MLFSLISEYKFLDYNMFYIYPTVLIIFAYILYVRKFKIYKCFQDFDNNLLISRPRGKCPPFFPNGWFRLFNSDELKCKEVKYINYFGRDIVVFRGTDYKVYALHAFCAHMGANLGIDGQVKHG